MAMSYFLFPFPTKVFVCGIPTTSGIQCIGSRGGAVMQRAIPQLMKNSGMYAGTTTDLGLVRFPGVKVCETTVPQVRVQQPPLYAGRNDVNGDGYGELRDGRHKRRHLRLHIDDMSCTGRRATDDAAPERAFNATT